KHSIADGSVGSPYVRVGHFQAPNYSKECDKPIANAMGFFTSGLCESRIILSFTIAQQIKLANDNDGHFQSRSLQKQLERVL
ncbi:hypothetical protein, partial [Shewanella intestini]|uniref:hypothetical protein n=1 Tax=Shewanella sp. XMDDZSB0408 TaxID=2664453 RepID=UPI001E3BC14B